MGRSNAGFLIKPSPAKALADEKMDLAEKIIRKSWALINSCARAIKADSEELKRIKALEKQGELFAELLAYEVLRDERLMEKCLKSLVETI
jgi:hypothetical protein